MNRYTTWMMAALLVVLAVGSAAAPALAQFPFLPGPTPTPGQPATGGPPPGPAIDPRLAQIKVGLEKEGIRVLDIWKGEDKTSNNDPQWFVETQGNYPQPTDEKVTRQALIIWGAMYDAIGKENPRTLVSGGQVWSKYGMRLHARLADLTALVNALQAARSDAEKQQAFRTFFKTVIFRVWDFERKQFVDQKDFINKSFVGG